MRGPGKEAKILFCALSALAATPGLAHAANRYVDSTIGNNAGTSCAQVAPCQTIAYAIANSSSGDTIVVDDGTYNESVSLGDGRSIESQNFVTADSGQTIVDGGSATAITVAASGAGHVRGLTVRSNAPETMALNGAAEVDSNTFDDAEATGTVISIVVSSGADGSNIHDNTIVDPAPSTSRARLGIYSPFTPVTIRDNDIQDQNVGVQVGLVNPGQTLVEGNEITGTHNLPFAGQAVIAGASGGGTLILRANEITDAADASTNGVSAGSGTTLERNEITGHNVGVNVTTDRTGITLFGDRLWGNGVGLQVSDDGSATPKASASATNVTAVDNSADIFVSSGALTLDSSIVETFPFLGTAECTISFSRANVIGSDASGCDAFQTTADPAFVDASIGDYHLTLGSPMIDAGNTTDPPAGAVDFDGDPRGLAAEPTCTSSAGRRDIGADEFNRGPPDDCIPPETTIDTGPADGAFIATDTPVFTFSSEPNATFECSADGEGFRACSDTGEDALGPLAEGGHSFAVRATDEALNTDPTPAAREFTVDMTDPESTITAGPPKRTRKRTARLRWEADDASPVTFECSLDAKPFLPCTSPGTYRGLEPGKHKLRVLATDAAGNEEAAPAARRWRVLRRR